MATTTFYCIKNERGRYLEGAPIDYNFWSQIGDARKFKSIAEIRSFMTRMLKHPGKLDITDWYIERHTVDDSYPITDIFTMSHTMALLKHQNTV
jgi:hypothetical protein